MKTHEEKVGVDELLTDLSTHTCWWLLSTYSSCREGISANIPSVISDMDPLTKLLSAHRHKQDNFSPGRGTVHCGSANSDAASGAQHISCSYSQRCNITGDGPGDLGGTDAHDGVLGARAS